MSVCQQNINILPPDVNKSAVFTVDSDAIRFGLKGLKTWGSMNDIIAERNANGAVSRHPRLAERMALYSV